MISSRTVSRLDLNFLGTALVIAAIGCFLVYSATYFSKDAPLFHKQILWVMVGIVLMTLFLAIDYHVFFDISLVLYGFGLAMLLFLLFYGRFTAHVRSWIHIGSFQFQPAEFMKIFTALVLARYFDSNERAYLNLKSFLMVALILGLPMFLIIIQPDLGTAVAFAPLIGVAMFFGGIKPKFWLIAILIALVVVPSGWFVLHDYQKRRILTFLNPELDPLGAGYQVTQARIAIGSGGIAGKGFKQGTQTQLEYLPARHTDFIFAVLGEEWGFVGVAVVLTLYLFLILQALMIAKGARDRGGTFLAVCLISFFIFHILINISMQIGLLPTTGIPLPLISYGGSATMMFFIAIGLILNVDYRRFVNV
jgi:rod shape determining protein RodA